MPHFYMHLAEPFKATLDAEGFDAPDLAAASLLVRRAAGQILAEEIEKGHEAVTLTFWLEDALGTRLKALRVQASVTDDDNCHSAG